MKSLASLLTVLLLVGHASAAEDALDVVNRQRAARGLPAFQRDAGLTEAAIKCADYRAARGIAGHVNDFAFVPKGSHADAAGCAAWESGFGACCIYENYKYCGAAWVRKNGKNYCHVFVRGRR